MLQTLLTILNITKLLNSYLNLFLIKDKVLSLFIKFIEFSLTKNKNFIFKKMSKKFKRHNENNFIEKTNKIPKYLCMSR